MAHRTFTDEEIAHALAVLRSNGGNAKRTASHLGISRTTLRGWAGRHSNKTGKSRQVEPERVGAAGEKLANTLEAISAKGSEKALEALERIEIRTATDLRNLLVGVGITTEKASFARGGPTNRTEIARVQLGEPAALRDLSLRVLEGGKKTA